MIRMEEGSCAFAWSQVNACHTSLHNLQPLKTSYSHLKAQNVIQNTAACKLRPPDEARAA